MHGYFRGPKQNPESQHWLVKALWASEQQCISTAVTESDRREKGLIDIMMGLSYNEGDGMLPQTFRICYCRRMCYLPSDHVAL